MTNFFSKAQHRYQPIPEDGKIVTSSFLDACNDIVPFFGFLGSAFSPVKSDISSKITKLRSKYETNPEKNHTIQDIVNSEIEEKTTKKKNSSTEALLWIKRALCFIHVFLQEVLTGEEDLYKCATKAHEQSLKKYQPWMVQKVFSLAMKSVPHRKDFMKALGPEASEEEVLKDIKEVVDEMTLNIDNINNFYQENGQDS